MSIHEVAIVGAGIAGLAAARELAAAGLDPVVLEKSRGLSGRAATRRWAGSIIDHGAQFFTVRSRAFAAQVDRWLDDGTCFKWCNGFHQWREGKLAPPPEDGHPRYAAREGISALGKSLARGLTVQLQREVEKIERSPTSWTLHAPGGDAIAARHLIVAAPAPQAHALLAPALRDSDPRFLGALGSVQFHPCLAAAFRIETPDPPAWRGIQCEDDMLQWIGNDTSKRPGDHGRTLWVVAHAGPEFSARWQEADPARTLSLMADRAGQIAGLPIGRADERMLHRWRYALVARGFDETSFLRSQDCPTVWVCGDAFLGARVEGAYNSGLAAAADLLAAFRACAK